MPRNAARGITRANLLERAFRPASIKDKGGGIEGVSQDVRLDVDEGIVEEPESSPSNESTPLNRSTDVDAVPESEPAPTHPPLYPRLSGLMPDPNKKEAWGRVRTFVFIEFCDL